MAGDPLPHLGDVRLIDHHCHGLVTRELDRASFEGMLTEAEPARVPADGVPSTRERTVAPVRGTLFDSAIGFAVRRWCAPVLGLPVHAEPDDYLARRAELGADEITRRFLVATGIGTFCVDTGFAPEPLLGPAELAAAADGASREVVRLETVAEQVVSDGTGGSRFADDVTAALTARVAAVDAVAVKTVAAYRSGLALPGRRPSPAAVTAAAGRWLDQVEAGAPPRLADPVLHAFLIWAGIDAGLPVQVHTGLGDTDTNLANGDPLLLTDLLRATATAGVPVVLLHCYPFHRHAAYLAQVFPHAFCDLGLATHNVGRRARAVYEETLELAPFGKLLFSTDAYGLPELYHLGTLLFRRALSGLLADGVTDGDWSASEADRLAEAVGAGNARRVYGLGNA